MDEITGTKGSGAPKIFRGRSLKRIKDRNAKDDVDDGKSEAEDRHSRERHRERERLCIRLLDRISGSPQRQ